MFVSSSGRSSVADSDNQRPQKPSPSPLPCTSPHTGPVSIPASGAWSAEVDHFGRKRTTSEPRQNSRHFGEWSRARKRWQGNKRAGQVGAKFLRESRVFAVRARLSRCTTPDNRRGSDTHKDPGTPPP